MLSHGAIIFCQITESRKEEVNFISSSLRYSRVCGSFHDFIDGELLLAKKLLNHGLLVFTLESSFRQFYVRYHDLVKTFRKCVSLSPPQPSSFVTLHRHFDKSNTTAATSKSGADYQSSPPFFVGFL